MQNRLQGFYSNFQKDKIRKEIQRYGDTYNFFRYPRNKFNETITDGSVESETFEIKGIYHFSITSGSHIGLNEIDGARIETKRVPCILCVKEQDDVDYPVKLDDVVSINGKWHRVIGCINSGEANFAYNISLELVR